MEKEPAVEGRMEDRTKVMYNAKTEERERLSTDLPF